MFFSGESLELYGETIFTPFRKEQIDCSAYKLRVGSELYVSPEKSKNKKPPISQLYPAESFTVPPGQFAFLITQEHVRIPFDLMAFINIRSGLKVQGLVNVSGFHVDPGYDGKLIFAVFNAGPKNIVIREGDGAFLMWLTRLENPSTKYARIKGGFDSISSELAANIPQEGVSLRSLKKELESVQQQFLIAKWIFATATSVAVSLLVFFIRAKTGS